MNRKLLHGLQRALRDYQFERTEDGRLFVAKERAFIGGQFHFDVNGKDVEIPDNTWVNESGNYLIDAGLAGGTQITSYYITAYKGNVTPNTAWTAANFDSNATEIDAADVVESARQAWTPGAVSSLQVDNYSSKAAFTVEPSTLALYGVAMLSTSAFGGTTGILVAATKFSAVRNLLIGDVFNIGYRFTVTIP